MQSPNKTETRTVIRIPIYQGDKKAQRLTNLAHSNRERNSQSLDHGILFTTLLSEIVFVYFQLHWVFVAAQGLSLVVVSRSYSLGEVGRLLTAGASPFVVHELQSTRAQQFRCTWAQLHQDTWNLPRPGIEPACPELVDGCLTTGPPGKSRPWHSDVRAWEGGLCVDRAFLIVAFNLPLIPQFSFTGRQIAQLEHRPGLWVPHLI